jgi:hypothetical protein
MQRYCSTANPNPGLLMRDLSGGKLAIIRLAFS